MTSISLLHPFLSGAFTMASIAAALVFREYWRSTHDRLFAIMALAFAALALEQTALVFLAPSAPGRHWVFLARLFAFVLIIAGIVDKNRSRAQPPVPPDDISSGRVVSEPSSG